MINKKKYILYVSILSSALVFFLNYLSKNYSDSCINIGIYSNETLCTLFGLFLLISVPITVFSVINLFVSESTFLSWVKFTKIYILFYVILVGVFPWRFGDAFLGTEKDQVALYLSSIYFFISLILIIYKSSQKEPK